VNWVVKFKEIVKMSMNDHGIEIHSPSQSFFSFGNSVLKIQSKNKKRLLKFYDAMKKNVQ
jgi:hypothetical protein